MALAILAPSVIDLAESVEPLIVGISFPTVSVLIHLYFEVAPSKFYPEYTPAVHQMP